MNSQYRHAPFLEGERIYLRELRVSDVNGTYYHWMNDPEITRYLESRFYPNSIDSLQEYVRSKAGNRNEIFLAIIVKEGNRHIGNIKLGPIDWIHRLGDIGIIIGEKEHWGKGYAPDAIRLMTDYAFDALNLHKVTAGCYSPNLGCLKAFRKSGFETEGLREKHFFFNGGYIDLILMGRRSEKQR